MAAQSNTSFQQEDTLNSGLHRHATSFQSGAVNRTSEMLPVGGHYNMNSGAGNLMFCDNSSIISNGSATTTAAGNLMFCDSSSIISSGSATTTAAGNLMFCDSSSIISSGSATTTAAGNSSSSLLLDSVPGLKHDAGLAVEWTDEEQYNLEEGLRKFKDEPSIMKYVKIAAMLREKTVRDVALRCWWMARKRIKQEANMLRKGNYRKILSLIPSHFGDDSELVKYIRFDEVSENTSIGSDKFVESFSKTSLTPASIPNVAPYSFQHSQMDQNQRLKCQVLSSKAKQLLERNLQALNQIDSNMTYLKLQDNIDLFCHARDNINNINVILNNMREFSGKMSQMQDLPISIDQSLVNSILPRTTL